MTQVPLSNKEALDIISARIRPKCKVLILVEDYLKKTVSENDKYTMNDFRKNDLKYDNYTSSAKELIMLCNTQNEDCMSLFE